MAEDPPLRFLDRPGGARLAYRLRQGAPMVVWLGGFMSDMDGTKATALDEAAAQEGWGYLRFDYFAHGRSTGAPEEASIGRWRADSLAVLDELTEGPLILVGSSMGGWMALLAARDRTARVAGLVLIAPAADFPAALIEPKLPDGARQILARGETWQAPMEYGLPPFPLSARFFEEARAHHILGTTLPFAGPVRILQGMADPDVPWAHALKTVALLSSPDLTLTLIKQGDHRLSTPSDLARLKASVADILFINGGGKDFAAEDAHG
jgi:pimeloyl-ACP methyl ester carboxylesterase